MLIKSTGIVLKRTPYSETSYICQLYTRDYGVLSLMLRGARKRKSPYKTNLLEPFSLLEVVAYFKENQSLGTVKELKAIHYLQSIRSTIYKTTIAIFCTELLQKTLKEEAPNPMLFQFLESAILWLETAENHYANFPLFFMGKLTHYLGFRPHQLEGTYFDYREGEYGNQQPNHPWHASGETANLLKQFFTDQIEEAALVTLNRHKRQQLITELIRFYSQHVAGFGHVKSIEVLEAVMD